MKSFSNYRAELTLRSGCISKIKVGNHNAHIICITKDANISLLLLLLQTLLQQFSLCCKSLKTFSFFFYFFSHQLAQYSFNWSDNFQDFLDKLSQAHASRILNLYHRLPSFQNEYDLYLSLQSQSSSILCRPYNSLNISSYHISL